MTSPADLARDFTGLDSGARQHLDRLISSWALLSDLSFSDLVLHVPLDRFSLAVVDAKPKSRLGRSPDDKAVSPITGLHFVVLAQIRPTTSQTLYELDLVGQVLPAGELPLVLDCWRRGVIVSGERDEGNEDPVRYQCVPVRWHTEVIGVLSRVWSPISSRRAGGLERTYVSLFNRLATMINDGLYPFVADVAAVEDAPRVGDGVVVLDEFQRISFASPNAVNAMHRMGIVTSSSGSTFAELGVAIEAVDVAYSRQLPVIEEVERRPDIIVLLRCIPLIERNVVVGAAILMRDVTDLRRRDRLLLSKDAAIREVHHRVKNNLQTISSLLRLQARRLDDGMAKAALAEAERRIAAIALVHEILSREPGEQVPFGEIIPALIRLARDGEASGLPVNIDAIGGAGDLPADIATPLAVVIAELLQNAVEHAFVFPFASDARVELRTSPGSGDGTLLIEVQDNGVGFPDGFDLDRTGSLGLAIVRDLVRSQLNGHISVSNVPDGQGALVVIEVPTNTTS